MSGYLLDTNVLSEARKGKRADAGVNRWMSDSDEESWYVSVLVLGEIRKGIERARGSDAAKALALEHWLGHLEKEFSDRLIPVTPAIADQWGRLSALRPLPVIDGFMAATALVHDLTLVTRNVRDVSHLHVKVLNPFAAQS